MKFTLIKFLIPFILACDSSQPEEVNFKGYWVEKSISENFHFTKENLNKKSISIPLIHFSKDISDSVSFFLKPDSIVKLPAFFRYHSYYINLGSKSESLIIYDYQSSNIIFKDLVRKKIYKYQKRSPQIDSVLFKNLSQYFERNFELN